MRKIIFVTIAASAMLAGAVPSLAATAANSQNGTDSSNPNATVGPPTSTSAVPATNMQMGTQPGTVQMQNGSTMSPNGTMQGGADMTTAPKQ